MGVRSSGQDGIASHISRWKIRVGGPGCDHLFEPPLQHGLEALEDKPLDAIVVVGDTPPDQGPLTACRQHSRIHLTNVRSEWPQRPCWVGGAVEVVDMAPSRYERL